MMRRRRFIQAVGAAGLLGPALWGRSGRAAPSAPVLSGTEFALEIGEMPFNVTGRRRTATAVNGQVPAPTLRWREGDTVRLAVTNRLSDPTSIHWHGILVPGPMDGVPGLSFAGIPPGETFVYQFPVRQSGTYWYHSHSAFQEQTGLYGALVIEPKVGSAYAFDRDYVVLLSDWTDENPHALLSNLKFQSDYHNYHRRTLGTFIEDARTKGLGATISDRLEWGKMRMAPTDILDVSGATYTYLLNGYAPAANWTALFKPGERVRLRFINGSSMSIFDVRIPGLPMTVVQSDGNDVEPVTVDQFRIGTAETYDVIVQPDRDEAFAIFVQAEDRSGFARGTLTPRPGMTAPIPPMDPRPLRTMADMGMGGMDSGSMAGMGHGSMPGMDHGSMPGMSHGSMEGMDHGAMSGMGKDPAAAELDGKVGVDNVAMTPMDRSGEPLEGVPAGRRVLSYRDLRALKPALDNRPPGREIVLHLTGNMQRFMWGFDGKKYSEAGPILLQLGERVRFTLINDSMMEHPMHLHGLWSELDNGQDTYRPYKHTILVRPGERVSFLVNADAPGRWAFHCHLLYHMEAGMFREVRVA